MYKVCRKRQFFLSEIKHFGCWWLSLFLTRLRKSNVNYFEIVSFNPYFVLLSSVVCSFSVEIVYYDVVVKTVS